jgi:hypothetical protein
MVTKREWPDHLNMAGPRGYYGSFAPLTLLKRCRYTLEFRASDELEKFRASENLSIVTQGSDHGAGHPLLILCPAKAPNYRKHKALKELDHYSKWPKVADAVIEATEVYRKLDGIENRWLSTD